jgi:hypothetical protein
MRINLNCPFAEKDQAKALGARWDGDRRVWYIVDVEDLTPFMRWLGGALPVKQSGKKHKGKRMQDRHPVKTTGAYVPLCNCTSPPWEDCEHTEALSAKAMQEMTARLPA